MMTKKAQVVMLPSGIPTGIYNYGPLAIYSPYEGKTIYKYSDRNIYTDKGWVSQHLYFTTDDEIKKDDWALLKDEHIRQVTSVDSDKYLTVGINNAVFRSICKKIVASTNKELWDSRIITDNNFFDTSKPIKGIKTDVFKIPTDFIEAYVREQGRIKEVLLECEQQPTDYQIKGNSGYVIWDKTKLKLRPNGTVIIHPVKEKMYSRDEVIKILSEYDGTYVRAETFMNKHYPQ
jgi:hypothetical protein